MHLFHYITLGKYSFARIFARLFFSNCREILANFVRFFTLQHYTLFDAVEKPITCINQPAFFTLYLAGCAFSYFREIQLSTFFKLIIHVALGYLAGHTFSRLGKSYWANLFTTRKSSLARFSSKEKIQRLQFITFLLYRHFAIIFKIKCVRGQCVTCSFIFRNS